MPINSNIFGQFRLVKRKAFYNQVRSNRTPPLVPNGQLIFMIQVSENCCINVKPCMMITKAARSLFYNVLVIVRNNPFKPPIWKQSKVAYKFFIKHSVAYQLNNVQLKAVFSVSRTRQMPNETGLWAQLINQTKLQSDL